MCLAIPGKVVEVKGNTAVVDFGDNITRNVDISLVKAKLGDYVMVHAGFAIEKVDLDAAKDTLKVLEEYENALRESTTQQKERKISHRKNIPA